jgi:hypothetical protein
VLEFHVADIKGPHIGTETIAELGDEISLMLGWRQLIIRQLYPILCNFLF